MIVENLSNHRDITLRRLTVVKQSFVNSLTSNSDQTVCKADDVEGRRKLCDAAALGLMSRCFPGTVGAAATSKKQESVTSYIDRLDRAETLGQYIKYTKAGKDLSHVSCDPATKLQLEMKEVLDAVAGLTLAGSVRLSIRHSGARIHIITVDVSDTIAYIKAIIERDESIPPDQQYLVYLGK